MTKKGLEAKKNEAEQLGRKKSFELRHGLLHQSATIGTVYQYDHKLTAAASTLMISLSIILKQGVWTYLYFLGLIKVVKDTTVTVITDEKQPKFKPLIYYLAAASIIMVAAYSTNQAVPGFQSGLTHYLGELL